MDEELGRGDRVPRRRRPRRSGPDHGARARARAPREVLVYDRLVGEELVAEAPADALRIARDRHDQSEVNRLLVEHGRAGKEVVRLKGGDPFVFGRGGEEVLALVEAGVPYEVVHGVSSIGAVPGAAGIPITHRGVSPAGDDRDRPGVRRRLAGVRGAGLRARNARLLHGPRPRRRGSPRGSSRPAARRTRLRRSSRRARRRISASSPRRSRGLAEAVERPGSSRPRSWSSATSSRSASSCSASGRPRPALAVPLDERLAASTSLPAPRRRPPRRRGCCGAASSAAAPP